MARHIYDRITIDCYVKPQIHHTFIHRKPKIFHSFKSNPAIIVCVRIPRKELCCQLYLEEMKECDKNYSKDNNTTPYPIKKNDKHENDAFSLWHQ